MNTHLFLLFIHMYVFQADDIRALLIDAMPPDALPSCLKPQATVVSSHTPAGFKLQGTTCLRVCRVMTWEARDYYFYFV